MKLNKNNLEVRNMRSKYLGKTFDNGWKVIRASKTADKHTRFTLARPTSDGKAIKHITLRDNELTKISRGIRTVESYLDGKAFVIKRFKANVFRNNVFYVFHS